MLSLDGRGWLHGDHRGPLKVCLDGSILRVPETLCDLCSLTAPKGSVRDKDSISGQEVKPQAQ